jgi:pseudouridine synthase
VVLRQGINRQIRRMFFALGYEVEKLIRTRVGHLRLGDLPRGHWRPLTTGELKSLQPPASR